MKREYLNRNQMSWMLLYIGKILVHLIIEYHYILTVKTTNLFLYIIDNNLSSLITIINQLFYCRISVTFSSTNNFGSKPDIIL